MKISLTITNGFGLFKLRTIVTLIGLLCTFWLMAQTQTISGKIVDQNGEAIPGVTVLEKGTSNGVLTDLEGNYTLSVSDGATLLVSFVGFKTQEIPINSSTTFDVTLLEDIQNLNEVVVIGYGEVNKAGITSAVASINQESLKNIPVPGIDQAIQGKLAGVTVSNNGGQPGGGVSVRVRGITSVNGNEPLYVIDGVPVAAQNNSLNQNFLGGGSGQTSQSVLATINPNDIKSIEVLKDASAQAIYGSRAANGVVLVTTKRGSGEGKITYDAYYGIQEIPKKLSVMNLRENAQYINDVIDEINLVEGGNRIPPERFRDPSILGEGTDWQDEIYRTGYVQNHMVSFSGSLPNSNYYFSLGAFDQKGVLIGTSFKRYSFRGNIESDVKDWLTTGFSINATRGDQSIGLADAFDAVTSVVLYNSPGAPVRDLNGDYVGQVRVSGENIGNPQNPVAMAKFRDVRALTTRGLGALYAEINLGELVPAIDGLSLRNEFNYDFSLTDNSAYQPFVYNEADQVNIISPSRLREQRTQNLFYSLKNYLSYRKTIAGDHGIYLTLGHEIQHGEYDYVQASRENLTLNLPSLGAGQGGNDSGETIGAGAGEYAIESYFGRLNYTYSDRYAVSFTLRADGSSSFGPGNRWGYFPAVSGAWTITNETFAQNIPYVAYLKLRGGYGTVGNQNVSANRYTANVNLVTISPFGNASLPANVSNPNLGWESVKTYNVGLDATLFPKENVALAVDLYRKVTSDMLLPNQLPFYSGLGTNYDDIQPPTTNAGKMVNTGIDLSITTNNISRPNLSWTSTIVFSKYKNTLRKLNSEEASIRGEFNEYGSVSILALTQEGYPVGSFFGYKTDGIYTNEDELDDLIYPGLDVAQNGLWLGDVKFKDLNGDDEINDKDVTVIGNPNPDFTLGFTNTVTYRNFDLSVFIYGSFGADIFNYTRRQTEALNSLYNNQLTTVLNRYTSENPSTSMPRYNQWHDGNRRISDRYIEDGSYIRIQNVQLGYRLPLEISSKARINSMRVYVSAQNLFTFTDYSGYDPELGSINDNASSTNSNNGILLNVDNGRYPVPKSVTIGVNIEF